MDYADYVKSVMDGHFNMIDGMEEAWKVLTGLPKKELRKIIKEAKELIRERCEDTRGYNAENDDINNNPNMTDKEKRLALYESRQRYLKRTRGFYNEMDRWNREIREEEEKREKLAKFAEQAKLAKPAKESKEDPSVSEDESETESETETEDSNSD